MRLLERHDVEDLLTFEALIAALEPAMVAVSRGEVSMPLRTGAVAHDGRGWLWAMPAFLKAENSLVSKLVTVFPGNEGRGVETHNALLVAFDADSGVPVAVMDASHLTAMRTSATSALATRYLARPGSSVLAVLGTGVQSRFHALAITHVVEPGHIRLAGRDLARALRVAEELEKALDIPVIACSGYEQALKGADIVCAATHTVEPIVRSGSLEPGVHVNSVGLNPNGREVDAEVVGRSRVVVEHRGAALADVGGANDLQWAVQEGLLGVEDVVELGEVISGEAPGRRDDRQWTLFKSVGIAVEDAAAAALILRAAEQQNRGRFVQF